MTTAVLKNLVCSAGSYEQTKMAANEEMPTKPTIMVEDYDKMKCDESKKTGDSDVVHDSAPQGKGEFQNVSFFVRSEF